MKKLLLLAMVLGLLVSSICYAQSGKEAVRALQKLQTRVEVGISYRDYAPALGDAKFEVDLFLKSPEAKEKEKLASRIERVMLDHRLALSVWGLYFAKLQQGLTRQGIIPIEDIQNLKGTSPEINMRLTDVIRNSPVRDKRFVFLSDVLNVMWKDAEKALQEANDLLLKN
jgi:hypothetical protein